MTRSKSVLPTNGAHGGRRPGSGAPKGNINGLKHGARSPRFWRAALIVAVVPELRLLFRALEHEDDRAERRRLYETLSLAYDAALLDPALARSIKDILRKRIAEAFTQIRNNDPSRLNFYLNQAIENALRTGALDNPGDQPLAED